jgi:hypothetical protein
LPRVALFIKFPETIGSDTSFHHSGFDKLLSRADIKSLPDTSLLELYLSFNTIGEEVIGAAPVLAKFAGLPVKGKNWIVAQLIHQHAGMNDVFTTPVTFNSQHEDLYAKYEGILRDTTECKDIYRLKTNPTIFLLSHSAKKNFKTIPLERAKHSPMSASLPMGSGAYFWISKANEFQMAANLLLGSSSTLNALPNGVWFWGEGATPQNQNNNISVNFESEILQNLANGMGNKLGSPKSFSSETKLLIIERTIKAPDDLSAVTCLMESLIKKIKQLKLSGLDIFAEVGPRIFEANINFLNLLKIWKPQTTVVSLFSNYEAN